MDPPRTFPPPMAAQFRPVVAVQQSQQFIPVASPHYQPLSYPPPMQQLLGRPGQPGHGPPPSHTISLANGPPSMRVSSAPSLSLPSIQNPSNYTPNLGGPGVPLSSSYTFVPAFGQIPATYNTAPQGPGIPSGGLSITNPTAGSVTPSQHSSEQASAATGPVSFQAEPVHSRLSQESTDWIEHVSANGKRYYYNRRTRQSSWERPLELMTPIERADATTNWKEFTSPDGRKYFYNKVTKQSKWQMPEEVKMARDHVERTFVSESQLESAASSQPPTSVPPSMETVSTSHTPTSITPSVHGTLPSISETFSSEAQASLSSATVVPIVNEDDSQPELASELSAIHGAASSITTTVDGVKATESESTDAPASGSSEVSLSVVTIITPKKSPENIPLHDSASVEKASAQDIELGEAKKGSLTEEKASEVNNHLEEKASHQDVLAYADKPEAKNAFKTLLESANVGSDWTWDLAMRAIITDRRYGALKTLGEKKQAFNEFVAQKRKQEAEERRMKQKKARDDFYDMLEESKEITSSFRWSKVVAMFENDERFKAIERERDRRDIFESYIQELGEKERAKAQEERKRNLMEYRQFLESCDFIKVSTQWRKVQDRLEADERCSRLEKIDRLEIFQDYLRDLEKQEEEQRKIQKEEMRKAERKNRDDFRKLMEEDIAVGNLTAKSHWRDYYMKVKDLPAYLAVASNASGSTPKDLFEDVVEELEKQYREDKTRVKDVMKLKQVALTSTWTVEDFKAAIIEDLGSPPITDVNLQVVFGELLERAREKEEKEIKRRKRLADDFLHLLWSTKEITASSKWENCKELFEGSREFSSIGEESICREIFEQYTTQLNEQAKENERKRKEEREKKEKEREERERRKSRHRRDKERGYEKEKEHARKEDADPENADTAETHADNSKKPGNDEERKLRKRHHGSLDDLSVNEMDRSKRSHRYSSSHRKSRRHDSGESDGEIRNKRHRQDSHNDSRWNGDYEPLEDGEVS